MAREHTSRIPMGFDKRGQSVYDYAVGVSLFLVVVLGVLTFVPTAFGSFNDPGGVDSSDDLAAERVANYLAGTAFQNDTVRSERPRRFDAECVLAFFNDTEGCGFDQGNAFAADAGLSKKRALNVTVESESNNGAHLCWDGTTGRVVGTGSAQCDPSAAPDVPLRNGSNAAPNEEFATATRSGRFGNRTVYVVVRTW